MQLVPPEIEKISLEFPSLEGTWSDERDINKEKWRKIGKRYLNHIFIGGKPRDFPLYTTEESNMMGHYMEKITKPRPKGRKINKFCINFDNNTHIPITNNIYHLYDYKSLRRQPLVVNRDIKKTIERTRTEYERGILLVISEFICAFSVKNLFLMGNISDHIENFIRKNFQQYCNVSLINYNEYSNNREQKFESVIIINEQARICEKYINQIRDNDISNMLVITSIGEYDFYLCDTLIIPWVDNMISLWFPWGIDNRKKKISIKKRDINYNQYSYYAGDWNVEKTVARRDHCFDSALEYQIIELCNEKTNKKITRTNFIF